MTLNEVRGWLYAFDRDGYRALQQRIRKQMTKTTDTNDPRNGVKQMNPNDNFIITPADRKLLAEAYEEVLGEGPYHSYANLARNAQGAFTLCSLRAVARARLGLTKKTEEKQMTKPLLSNQALHDRITALTAAQNNITDRILTMLEQITECLREIAEHLGKKSPPNSTPKPE